MSGYVPLFASLTTGTLCGRWPDVGLWPIVLSLADRYGIVDVTPDYLAHVTGLPVVDVAACMDRFCAADPRSRSTAEGGARLVLIDPEHRTWGWRVVNHSQYRERARKMAFDAERVADGRNANRMAARRPATTRDDPRASDATRPNPPSDKTRLDKTSGVSEDRDSRPQRRTGNEFHCQIIAAYHEVLPDLPRVKVWTRRRAQALDARIRERCKDGKPADTIGYWRSLFEQVAASPFLCGRSTDFRAHLEWLIKPENFAKVIEGRYAATRSNGAVHAR